MQTNLLTNPGFESGTTGWGQRFGGTLSTAAPGRTGSTAGRLTGRTAPFFGIQQSVLGVVIPGKSYVVSAWVKTNSATSSQINLGIQQDDNRGVRSINIDSKQIADGWTQLTGLFPCVAEGPLKSLQFFVGGAAVGLDLFLDDASVTEVDISAPENLVENWNFEQGTSSWVGRNTATVAVTTRSHTGAGAALIENRPSPSGGIEQSLLGKTEPGRTYYASVWVSTDSAASDTVKLAFETTDGGVSRRIEAATGKASNTGWTWLSGYFTIPENAGLTGAKVLVDGPIAGVALRVDNAYVTPVTGLRHAARLYPEVRLGWGGMAAAEMTTSPIFKAALSAHFHFASPGNALKFGSIEPTQGVFNWAEADTILDLGLARGGASRGHVFVWHSQVPTWVQSSFTPAQLQSVLFGNMDRVSARYANRLPYWDVVNEAMADSGGVLRSTLWYDAPGIGYAANGSQYIAESFIRARRANPNAILTYNDYATERVNAKSTAIYNMLSGFVCSGVPVNAVGFQTHLVGTTFDEASFAANLQRFQNLGLDLEVTEFDVRLPVDANGRATAANLAGQGDVYFEVFGTALGFSRMKVFQIWGATDASSWIPDHAPGFGQALPFDFSFDKKPAYWGLWNALAGQVEKMAVETLSIGDNQAVVADSRLSAGAGRKFSPNAANDFVTVRTEVPFKGQWNVKIGVLRQNTGGQFQLAAAPGGGGAFTNLGTAQETYAASAAATSYDLGTVTFSSAGDWQFRFTVAGKSPASTGYDLTLDYIRLTPVSCEPTVTELANQEIVSNTALTGVRFMAEDDTASGSLIVGATSSNPGLLPAANIVISGASPYYTLSATPVANQTGTTTVTVSASDGTTTSTKTFVLTVSPTPNPGRLINLSILTNITAADPQFTVGTVIGGAGTSGTKPLLVRAAGPSLTAFGVGGALADPKLELFSGQTVTGSNDNWGGTNELSSAFTAVGAFAYASPTSNDAAVFNAAMAAGGYTVQVSGVGGATGTVIAELYDSTPSNLFTPSTPRLVNVSVLKQINAGETLTAGFVIGGVTSKQVLIRAVGPTLGAAPFNIGGVLADPKVELFSGQTLTSSNDNWDTPSGTGAATAAQLAIAFSQVGAFALQAGSKDAVLLVTLAPGSYTAQVRGVNNTSGLAIVEVYEVN